MADRGSNPSGMKILIALTIAVGAVWIGSMLTDMFNPAYDPPEQLGVVFMSITSALLGVIAAAKGRSDDDDGRGPERRKTDDADDAKRAKRAERSRAELKDEATTDDDSESSLDEDEDRTG